MTILSHGRTTAASHPPQTYAPSSSSQTGDTVYHASPGSPQSPRQTAPTRHHSTGEAAAYAPAVLASPRTRPSGARALPPPPR